MPRVRLPLPQPAEDGLPISWSRRCCPQDDRVWVPQAPNVWFRPLCLVGVAGLLGQSPKVTRAGVLSRHRHHNPVHGYVLKGRWRYLEHDWVAEEGGYVYEPPGETHTLVVPRTSTEMITLFQVNGIMLYVDPDGSAPATRTCSPRSTMCRTHYAGVRPRRRYVDRFIR